MARSRHFADHDDVPPARVTGAGLRDALKLYGYLWPYRVKFALGMTALTAASLLGLAFPYLAGRLVDGAGPNPTGRLDVDTAAALLMLVLALRAGVSYFQTYWLTEVGERSLADLRRDSYAKLIRLPMGFFAQRRVGELTSRIAADLSQIQDALTGAAPQFLRQVVMLVGGLSLLAVTSGRLTAVMLLSVPLLIGAAVVFGRAVRRQSADAQDRLADTNVIVDETLQGIAGVKAYGNEGYEEGRYRSGMAAVVSTALRGARYRGAFSAFVIFALFGAVVFVLWYGARLARAGELSLGDLTQFLLYTIFVGGAIGSFAELYAQLQRTVGATQRVREILAEMPEDAGPAASSGKVVGHVQFENVAFSYPSRKEVPVLRDFCLEAKAGERVALVGPSGAGKSTVVSLLLRFYDPDGGRVLIDGRDARELPLADLRAGMAVVPQDVVLFGGTIFDNIRYGRPGAAAAEVQEAARRANAHEFIAKFPDGYQTLVGERGVKLSGGQRQRVAIARAILRDPAILILDEATSSLDSESERLVQEALDGLMSGRTSVIVAHRLATIRGADRIYVLKDGRVAESGTHAELIARPGGVYRALSGLQFGSG